VPLQPPAIGILGVAQHLDAGEVCWRMSSRWREENYLRYARTWFAAATVDGRLRSVLRIAPNLTRTDSAYVGSNVSKVVPAEYVE
jgi:hypothetical protein